MALYALRKIPTVAHAFEVVDHAVRLIEHAKTRGPSGETQIGVLVVGRGKALVKPAEALPQRAANRQAGPGYVIDLLQVVVRGFSRIVGAAEVPARGVAPDNPAGLLQTAIGRQQLRAGNPHIGLRKGREQGLQPAPRDHRVVIEKHQILAPGLPRGELTVAQKAQIARRARHPNAAQALRHRSGEIRRSVVADNDLIGDARAVRMNGAQGVDRDAVGIKHGHDDRNARRIAVRELQSQAVEIGLMFGVEAAGVETAGVETAGSEPRIEPFGLGKARFDPDRQSLGRARAKLRQRPAQPLPAKAARRARRVADEVAQDAQRQGQPAG